jgi:2-oxoisovalerate ferredoxin oxidoreductase beta subunit
MSVDLAQNKKRVKQKAESFYDAYERNPNPDKKSTHYCPGCGHGNVHKFIAEALDDYGVADKTIFVSPVGCSVFAYYYFNTGNIQAAHGRAPAVATGAKRTHQDAIVISYQGDGDLAAIGTAELIHSANRGENITIIFINNSIYGMTGGQMAPTTLVGQKTTTTPRGRNPQNEGYPVKVAELIAQLEAPVYVERTSLHNPKERLKARKSVRKAIKAQVDRKGFSLIEILSPCPSGWKMDPVDSLKYMEEVILKQFPLGVYKDKLEEAEPYAFAKQNYQADVVNKALGLDKAPEPLTIELKPKLNIRDPEIKVAGFGGQGVLSLGVALAQSAMLQDYNVSWIPSYGPEMRGGTANCIVQMKHRDIGSPVISRPDVLIAFNRPSLKKFIDDVKSGGLIIYDSSLIDVEPERDDVTIIALPATKIADELGNTRVANMVAVGAFIEATGLLSEEAVSKAMPLFIPRERLIAINREAVRRGMEHISSQ